jgi:predicted nucleic acid-binding protein
LILVDLNVLLDVLQKREPHYRASAGVLEDVVRERVSGALAAHGVTTVHYLVRRARDGAAADGAVDWLLRYFSVLPVGAKELQRARALGWPDFEDAVVAAAAETGRCAAIVTRNVKDFAGSPVEAMTPEEYLVGR